MKSMAVSEDGFHVCNFQGHDLQLFCIIMTPLVTLKPSSGRKLQRCFNQLLEMFWKISSCQDIRFSSYMKNKCESLEHSVPPTVSSQNSLSHPCLVGLCLI